MEILHLKDLGDTSVISECSLGVNLVIGNFLKIWGYKCRLAANAVVLVLGEYPISIAK